MTLERYFENEYMSVEEINQVLGKVAEGQWSGVTNGGFDWKFDPDFESDNIVIDLGEWYVFVYTKYRRYRR